MTLPSSLPLERTHAIPIPTNWATSKYQRANFRKEPHLITLSP